MLLRKYLDDQVTLRAVTAQLLSEPYECLFHERFRWSESAAPKTADGGPDRDKARVGADLVELLDLSIDHRTCCVNSRSEIYKNGR